MTNNNIEILINGLGYIKIGTKMYEEFGIPVIYNVDNIDNISSRKSNYTKTIKIHGNRNNNKILGQLYNLNIDSEFDITIKHPCVLTVNKNPILTGFFSLNSIDKYLIGDKYQVFYDITIYGEIKNLFDSMGEKKLSDLDFSSGFTITSYDYEESSIEKSWLKGNHILNEDVVVDSYTTKYPFYYPVFDYGYDLDKIKISDPYWSGGTPTFDIYTYKYPYHSISLGLLYPSVYIKAILDKIFLENGYTYTSNFLNGESYDDLFGNILNICNNPEKIVNKNYCSYFTYADSLWFTPQDSEYNPTWPFNILRFIFDDSITEYNVGIFSGLTYNAYNIDNYTMTSEYQTSYYDNKVLEGYFNDYGAFIITGETIDEYHPLILYWVQLYGIRIKKDGFYNIKYNMDLLQDRGGEIYSECSETFVNYFKGERDTNLVYNFGHQKLELETIISDPYDSWSMIDQGYYAPFSTGYSFTVYFNQLFMGPVDISYSVNGGDKHTIHVVADHTKVHFNMDLIVGDFVEFYVKGYTVGGMIGNLLQDAYIESVSSYELKESEYRFFKYSEDSKKTELIRTLTTSEVGGPYFDTITPLSYSTIIGEIELKEGDCIFCQIVPGNRIRYTEEDGCVFLDIDVILRFASIELKEVNKEENFTNLYNTEINLSNFLPNIKQSDFLKEIIKLFNLQISTNYNIYNNFIIEPRDDYYNNIIDLTDKIDYSKPINIKNLNDKNYNIVDLTYLEPNDYLGKEYKKINNKIYGSYKKYNDSSLFKDMSVLDIQLSSYLTKYSRWVDYDISSIGEKIDTTYEDEIKEINPLFGIKNLQILDTNEILRFANYNNYQLPGNDETEWRFNQYLYSKIDGEYYPILPTVSFISNIGGNDYSMEFSGNTSNNLYSLFYKNQIENLQNKDCRYVTLYMNLKLKDIINLDFRKKVYINGQIYILQKIEYDPSKNISSKVELLKLVSPYESGVPGESELLSIQHFNGPDDYFQPEDPDRIKISD